MLYVVEVVALGDDEHHAVGEIVQTIECGMVRSQAERVERGVQYNMSARFFTRVVPAE